MTFGAFVRCCPCGACGAPDHDDQRTQGDHRPTRGSGRSCDSLQHPLCAADHTGPEGIHTIGEETFQRKHGYRITELIAFLHAVYDRCGVEDWPEDSKQRGRELGNASIKAFRKSMGLPVERAA